MDGKALAFINSTLRWSFAVCGLDKYCAIIAPPKLVQDVVDDSVASVNPSSSGENARIRTVMPAEDVHEEVVEPREIGVTLNAKESEMVHWKAKGISKKIVQHLESGDAAACFVALLLNYEVGNEEKFCELKEMMVIEFRRIWTYGATLVYAENEETIQLLDILLAVLVDVMKEVLKTPKKMRVNKFCRLASQ